MMVCCQIEDEDEQLEKLEEIIHQILDRYDVDIEDLAETLREDLADESLNEVMEKRNDAAMGGEIKKYSKILEEISKDSPIKVDFVSEKRMKVDLGDTLDQLIQPAAKPRTNRSDYHCYKRCTKGSQQAK